MGFDEMDILIMLAQSIIGCAFGWLLCKIFGPS